MSEPKGYQTSIEAPDSIVIYQCPHMFTTSASVLFIIHNIARTFLLYGVPKFQLNKINKLQVQRVLSQAARLVFHVPKFITRSYGASVAKWLAHLPFTSEAPGSSLSENFSMRIEPSPHVKRVKSQRSAESRGLSPVTPVSSHS
jgi:hypothetical protein